MPNTISVLDSAGATQVVVTNDKIDAKIPALGVAASAGATPVVIASDDAQIGVKVTAISALPAGGTGLIGWLSRIWLSVSGLPAALGQGLMAASMPVTIASDQSALSVTDTRLPSALGAGGGVKIDGSGTALPVSGTVGVNNFPSTQPISAAALPLPAGASTEATLAALNTKVPANLTVTATRLLTDGSGVTQPVSGTVAVSNLPATQAISAAALPLPAGASTETTLAALNTKVPANLTVTATRLLTDGSGVTQPVSGTFWQATQPVSGTVAVSALPAGTNTIGQVNGNGASVEVVPTVTAGAYTAGNVIGGVMTFANILPASFNGVLESITLKFKASVQAAEYDVALFTASPAGTYTDKVLPTFNAADSAILLGIFPLTVNQSTLGTHTVYTLDGIAKQIVGSATSLYAVVTTKGTPTPASISDMSLRLGMIW